MHWEPDVDRGEWLRPRLDAVWRAPFTMHCVVPRGFPAYVRVFHPTRRVDDPHDAPPRRWSEPAATWGTIPHPSMQWESILGTAPAGRSGFDAPQMGRLEETTLSVLAGHLTRATSTPAAGVAAVWEGWGDLFASGYGHSWMVLGGGAPDPIPGLSDVERDGPRLQLPDRGYLLFDAGVTEFGADDWPDRAPWTRHPWAQSPSILWPEDHAWALVSEIDWDSTVIAGARELIEAIADDRRLEALEIPRDADLTEGGDLLNQLSQ